MDFKRRAKCPHCGKGFVSADEEACGTISVQCNRCHKFYLVNLATLKTVVAHAQQRNMVC